MEELVSSVKDPEIRDYMSESLACYMAGAYRASVVLTFIALFDDILIKLGELGKVNKKAKTVFDEATKKRTDQEIFETYLIDQLRAHSLFSLLDAGFLEILRTLRNKAAHPSGHHASAEEARFVFFESVSRFLSKPILSTTQLADEILAGISNVNFFPSKNIKVITDVVKKELINVHPDTFPYLVTKLLEKTQSTDSEMVKNARFFLCGLAETNDIKAVAALKKYAIEKFASSKPYHHTIIILLSANARLFQDLDPITYQRLAVLINDSIAETSLSESSLILSHPAYLFRSFFLHIPTSFVLEKLGKEFNAFLERFTYNAYFGACALKHKEPRDLLLGKLYQNAGSYDFATANSFISHISDVESSMASGLEPEEAFKLLVNVVRAARVGAFSSIDLRNSFFASTPKLKAKAIEFHNKDVNLAKSIASELLSAPMEELEKLLNYLLLSE